MDITGAGGADLEIRNVSRRFPNGGQELEVLTDVSFDLAAGDRLAITGESGSGKSTLLSLIGGLDKPDSGTIRVGSHTVHALEDGELTEYRAGSVGLVFQFHYLLQDFSALENVMLPALMRTDRDRGEVRDRAAGLLDRVGLSERSGHMPAQLSGGERQRVALARALVNDPPLILADEPTGNLDERNSRTVEEILFSLVADYGRTLVLVTHNGDLADRVGRRLELEHGCLLPV